jgi:hypothetical protein
MGSRGGIAPEGEHAPAPALAPASAFLAFERRERPRERPPERLFGSSTSRMRGWVAEALAGEPCAARGRVGWRGWQSAGRERERESEEGNRCVKKRVRRSTLYLPGPQP